MQTSALNWTSCILIFLVVISIVRSRIGYRPKRKWGKNLFEGPVIILIPKYVV